MTRISTYRMNKILYNKINLKGFRDPRQNPTAHKNLRPVYGQNTMSTMSTLKKTFIKLQFQIILGTDHLMGGWGVMVICFVQNFFSNNTRIRIFIFFARQSAIFFPEFNIRLYDKNSESDYFFFLHQNQNIFFSNIRNQNIFLEKNHNTPLQVKWSFPYR